MATKIEVKRALVEAGIAEWHWPRGADDAVDGFTLQVRKGVVALIWTGGGNHEKILARIAGILRCPKYAGPKGRELKRAGLAVTRKGSGLLIRSWEPCPSCGENSMVKTKRGFR